jgi:hypothetical protein
MKSKPKSEKVNGKCRKLHNMELHGLYSSQIKDRQGKA